MVLYYVKSLPLDYIEYKNNKRSRGCSTNNSQTTSIYGADKVTWLMEMSPNSGYNKPW